jgi:hypothetical protein
VRVDVSCLSSLERTNNRIIGIIAQIIGDRPRFLRDELGAGTVRARLRGSFARRRSIYVSVETHGNVARRIEHCARRL